MINRIKSLLVAIVLGVFCCNIGFAENKSEINRKKTTIKLKCELKKVNIIKNYEGESTDVWLNTKWLKENMKDFVKPFIVETDPGSRAMWMDKIGALLHEHDDTGIYWLNERATKKSDYITLSFSSINYPDLKFLTESSMHIKKDDKRYEYNFKNKPDMSSIGYGSCERLK